MPYNKCFIDQASSVKMAGYWPRSLFTFLWSAFHLNGKIGFPGGKPNGTGLSTGNFFEKKGIPSEVFLFSRFHRNYRKITVPFALSH